MRGIEQEEKEPIYSAQSKEQGDVVEKRGQTM